MYKMVLILLAILPAVPGMVSAQASSSERALITESIYHGCVKAATGPASGADDSARAVSIPRMCNCAASRFVDSLDQNIMEKLALAPNPSLINQIIQDIPKTTIQQTVDWCKTNYTRYEANSPNWASHKSKNTNNSILFDGQSHRFTAFMEEVYDDNRQLLSSSAVEPGRVIVDLIIPVDRTSALIVDKRNGSRYALSPLPEPRAKARELGYDFYYFIPEFAGELILHSQKSLMILGRFDLQDGRQYVTYYVHTNALICSVLANARTAALASAVGNILREILLATLKSYAGASYSRGNFTAYTSNGASVQGTYSLYDNSWLGEHYSRGLDTIFQGTATVSQINTEMEKLQCNRK